ncbi:MAG: hypothetical protein KGJ57_18020 [Sphingomonadales bacterium]|nr:hypothetical protein [Sphingomonadales bacterium]MDE2171295.1 hypothetical protein [Sphingomonadales bacterium]
MAWESQVMPLRTGMMGSGPGSFIGPIKAGDAEGTLEAFANLCRDFAIMLRGAGWIDFTV